ncbi:MAG: hypothetical protein IJ553_00265 [Alloprevotella sp.]|nr:hypothetical protein [Alloprevotella sp.]
MDFFFFSPAAIYDQFTPLQVGVTQKAIYAMHLSRGGRYENSLCTIRVVHAYRKKQQNPHRVAGASNNP